MNTEMKNLFWKISPRISIGVWIVVFFGAIPTFAYASNQALRSVVLNPISLYGEEIIFDVFRDSEKVGKHTVNFKSLTDNKTRVRARFELEITFLSIPFYSYLYQSSSVWQAGRLQKLYSSVDDNGERTFVRAVRKDDGLMIVGSKNSVTWPTSLYPTNHWNAGVRDSKHVLNTLTGEVSPVGITKQTEERIQAQGGWVLASRYKYSGSIDTTVWYDQKGRWLKMRFVAKDGSTIDYQCVVCGLNTQSNVQSKRN